jgi:hypothetical protein
VAAWVPDMFCNFYLVKSYKISNNSATTEARERIYRRFGISRILEILKIGLTKFENYQIYLIKLATDF